MEIFKDSNIKENQEFINLLNNQFKKNKNLSEGKIIEGRITKVTEKIVFVDCGLKSEAIVEISELKQIGLEKKIKENEKISLYLDRIEDKSGNVVVSATKASQISTWKVLMEKFKNNEHITGKFKQRVKGGMIVEHIDTGFQLFCPGSQVFSSTSKEKDVSTLMGEPQKFALIKMDEQRGVLPPQLSSWGGNTFFW